MGGIEGKDVKTLTAFMNHGCLALTLTAFMNHGCLALTLTSLVLLGGLIY